MQAVDKGNEGQQRPASNIASDKTHLPVAVSKALSSSDLVIERISGRVSQGYLEPHEVVMTPSRPAGR